MLPTSSRKTGKMGVHFPGREKSGNFKHWKGRGIFRKKAEKVREI